MPAVSSGWPVIRPWTKLPASPPHCRAGRIGRLKPHRQRRLNRNAAVAGQLSKAIGEVDIARVEGGADLLVGDVGRKRTGERVIGNISWIVVGEPEAGVGNLRRRRESDDQAERSDRNRQAGGTEPAGKRLAKAHGPVRASIEGRI
jgi:hypothetical protein